MRVLIACEFSGIVRRAFAKHGHFVISVDLLPAEDKAPFGDHNAWHGQHYQGSIIDFLAMGRRGEMPYNWDLMVAFPPCTHIAVCGARWFKNKIGKQRVALEFMRTLLEMGIGGHAPIPRVAVENPIGVFSTWYRKPDQIIQPWQFGHGETKATCLWLKNLPKLTPTKIVAGRKPRVHHASPGPDRWKERSRTLPGIGDAMAEQWGNV